MAFAVWTGLEPATSGVTGRHSNQLNYQTKIVSNLFFSGAVWTGLEPATSGVTGRHSNQLNYQTREVCFPFLLKRCKDSGSFQFCKIN
jgi:hypothetical protein